MYHAAGIRQGPFRVELPLPAPVDPEHVETRYEHGLLRISLHKAGGQLMAVQPAGPPDFVIPDALPVLPLRDVVVLPLTAVPLSVAQPRSLRLVDDVMRGNRLLALVAQRDAKAEPAAPEDLYRVGTVGMIHQLARVPDGSVRLMVQGIERVRLLDWVGTEPYLVARIEAAPDQMVQAQEVDALRRAVVDIFRRLVAASAELPDELAGAAESFTDPRQRRSTSSRRSWWPTRPRGRSCSRRIPSRPSCADSSTSCSASWPCGSWAARSRPIPRSDSPRSSANSTCASSSDPFSGSSERTRAATAMSPSCGAKSKKPACPRKRDGRRERELARLASIPPASPEHGIVVTYLEWMASLPWSKLAGGLIDIGKARQVLDEDHFDLEKIKDRILEYLAVKKLRQERADVTGQSGGAEVPVPASPPPVTGDSPAREPILCFVGPPGVGKTSLGQSIARALGRRFVRMSLGGVRDEAEIRGHRRTYIGAMPGRIIQGIRRAETRDPVFMLDEIDKIGADWRGDPSSALLEVLDPAQNNTFVDNYLGVAFDLSQVLFIATANTLDTIPGPLRDRMESPDAVRLHGRGEGRDRPTVPDPEAARRPWSRHPRAVVRARRHPPDRAQLHA